MNQEPVEQSCTFIVDNEHANLKLRNKLFSSQGYRGCVLIQDPREVLDRYREVRPELIMLGINMLPLDGYQDGSFGDLPK